MILMMMVVVVMMMVMMMVVVVMMMMMILETKCTDDWEDCCASEELWDEPQTCAEGYVPMLDRYEESECEDRNNDPCRHGCGFLYECRLPHTGCHTEYAYFMPHDAGGFKNGVAVYTSERSAAACQARCAAAPTCAFFTFYAANRGACALSSSAAVQYSSTVGIYDVELYPYLDGGPISGPEYCTSGNQSLLSCNGATAVSISGDSLSTNGNAPDELRHFMHAHGYKGFVSSHVTLPINDTCPGTNTVLIRGIAYFPAATSTISWGIRDATGTLSPIARKEPSALPDASHAFCVDVAMQGVYSVETLDYGGCRPMFADLNVVEADPLVPQEERVDYILGEEGSRGCACGEVIDSFDECEKLVNDVYPETPSERIASRELEEMWTSYPKGCYRYQHVKQDVMETYFFFSHNTSLDEIPDSYYDMYDRSRMSQICKVK
eukprot:gene6268-7517_t